MRIEIILNYKDPLLSPHNYSARNKDTHLPLPIWHWIQGYFRIRTTIHNLLQFFTRVAVLITFSLFIIIVFYVFVSQFYRIPFSVIRLFNRDLTTIQSRSKLVVLHKTHECNTQGEITLLNVNNVVYVYRQALYF